MEYTPGTIYICIIILITIIISTAYNFLIVNRILYGTNSIYINKYKDLSINEFLTLIPLIVLNILLGIFTNPLTTMLTLPFTF